MNTKGLVRTPHPFLLLITGSQFVSGMPPEAHARKAWSPVQQRSELEALGSAQITGGLTYLRSGLIH